MASWTALRGTAGALGLVLLLASNGSGAAGGGVATPEDFSRAASQARPGDTITIADGSYRGWQVEATQSGSATARAG